MNWTEFARQIGEINRSATAAELFRFWVCLVQDRQYRWGSESIAGADCSGTIALGLFGARYNVRLTADLYLRLLFPRSASDAFDPGDIAAIFYLANSDRGHGPGSIKKGSACHVTPIIGEGVVLDAAWEKPARIRTIAAAEKLHAGFDTTPIHAAIDWAKLETLHLSGKYPVDDKELLALIA